ncbi:MAG: ribose 5-phosphate isomerase A [Waddliaceae bacterium]|nr:ribose 5-phosphate isomerase A [Waddliaceae bacterium]
MIESPSSSVKQRVAYAAAELVQSGMVVGLGTGSTAFYFIQRLIERAAEGLNILTVATSQRSAEQAHEGGLKVLDVNEVKSIDLTVDGADEIDPQNRMIKGGGGALLREKIIASSSKKMVVIVDSSKCVEVLGAFGLPVEIVPFGYKQTIRAMKAKGYKGNLRQQNDGDLYHTDNGNYLIDLQFPDLCHDAEKTHQNLISIPGVVETGFFFNLVSQVYIGHEDGRIEIRT